MDLPCSPPSSHVPVAAAGPAARRRTCCPPPDLARPPPRRHISPRPTRSGPEVRPQFRSRGDKTGRLKATESSVPLTFSVLLRVGLAEMSKMIWDPYHTRVFCDICMEEVNGNNRDGGCLSRKGYKNLGDKFAEKTGERLTQKQFKNKWDSLKKDYTGWMELQNATGLGWDPITKTMDADDDWWKNHIVIRPDHAKFRNGPPPNLEQQDVMFRKAHVTGQSAAIAGQQEGNGNETPIMLDDDTSPSNNAIAKRKHVENEMETGKRKHVGSDFFSAYNNALNTIVSRHTEGSSSSKDDQVPTMKEFLGMVRDCGVSEGTAIMYTAGKLAMNKDHREVFAAFATTAGRLDWLQRTHDEMNK